MLSFQKVSSYCFLSFCVASLAQAQMSSLPSSGSIQAPSSIQPLRPTTQPVNPTPPPRPVPIALPRPTPKNLSYFHPGILVLEQGQWRGSDHLLNLGNQVAVYVEIVKPEGDKLAISQDTIQRNVQALFNSAGLNSVTLAGPDQPPLPAFQIKIFLYPVEQGYSAFCEGRLFESVILKRFNLDPGMAYEAITWQRQSLLVTPSDKAIELIDKQVNEITASFLEIFQFFDKFTPHKNRN